MSEAQKQRPRKLLWMLGFDGKSVSNGHGTNYIYILTGGIHKNVIAYTTKLDFSPFAKIFERFYIHRMLQH